MDNSTRHSPSGVLMALVGILALALLIIMIYGFATSNPEIIKQIISADSESETIGDDMYYDGAQEDYSEDYNDGYTDGNITDNGDLADNDNVEDSDAITEGDTADDNTSSDSSDITDAANDVYSEGVG